MDSAKIQQLIYSKMPLSQKWLEVCRLREMAWALKKSSLRLKHPGMTEEQLDMEVRKIFLHAVT